MPVGKEPLVVSEPLHALQARKESCAVLRCSRVFLLTKALSDFKPFPKGKGWNHLPRSEASHFSGTEYQVGQLYSVAEASKNETGGGEGIQVLKNEPYEKDGEKGQYTHKIYHLKSKVPGFVRMIAPEGSLVFHEKAWNAYPYCRTIVTNEYMKDDFFIKIETWHKPDLGTSENVHNLDPNTWKSVEVVHIDIADRTQVEPGDYKADEDPALFQSVKTQRGPLGPNWKKELATDEECPKMCAYKLVTIKFKWWGLQNKVENFIQKQEKRIFTNFHRQLFCWIDKWIELTMEDIRRMEDETQKELEAMRKKGSVRGTLAADV